MTRKNFWYKVWEYGMPFATFMVIFLMIFNLLMWETTLEKELVAAVVGWLVMFFGYGIWMVFVNRNYGKRFAEWDKNTPDKIYEEAAAFHRKWNGEVGWLRLTKEKLMFNTNASRYNLEKYYTDVNDIEKVQPKNSFGVPVGLEVILKDGTTKFFSVENQDVWLDKFNKLNLI